MKKYFITVILLLVASLQADYVMQYQMDGQTQTFMYHSDNSSKMINSSDGHASEIYKIGEKTYIVSVENGKKKVIDTAEMRAMTESIGLDVSAYAKKQVEDIKYKINKTSKRVKVAGIRGEVWIVSGEQNGKKFKEEVVVTKDKEVAKVVRSMFKTFTSMSGVEIEDNFLEIQKGYVAIKADGMELKSFEEKQIASDEYQLPQDAQKQKMPNFQGMIQGMMKKNGANEDKPSDKEMENIDMKEVGNLLKSFF